MIDTTFEEKLTSSVGAFDLLNNFNNIETRAGIQETLSRKFENVLERYAKELDEMEKMFTENEKNPPIPKNMPLNSGKIAWARSIITRIKTPIDKFKTKQEILTGS